MEWWGIHPFQPLKLPQKEKAAEILVRGQSKHKWKWKFIERERDWIINRGYMVIGPKKTTP